MMDRVDGGDDSGGRDEGRRCSHLFSFCNFSFLSSFDFSPLSSLLPFFFKEFQKTRMMMWRSFRISEERM